MEVECEFCKKSFSKPSILVHIGRNESCKSHYGNRFDELKRKKNNEKKQRSRKKLGTEKEYKRQRELYAQNSRKKEKKKQYSQEKQSKLASEDGGEFEKVNITSRENYSNMESIKFDLPTTYKGNISALPTNSIVLNPNQSLKSNVVEKKDSNGTLKDIDPTSNEANKEFENLNDKRACKFCKKKFSLSTILKHLSHNAACKSSYGNKYMKLERKIVKEKRQLAKEKNTENKEESIEKNVDNPNFRMEIHETKIPEHSVDDLNNDSNVCCKFCKRQFPQQSLLRHISRNKLCRAFYGQEFDDMKKRKISNRKKQMYKEKMIKEIEERKKLFKEKQKRKQNAKEKLADNAMLPEIELNQNESDISEESDELVSCEFCKEKFISKSILIHIAKNKSCKSHYGPKFDEMKKENNRMKMQLYRQRIGSNKEIELYASDPRKKEKKKQYYILNKEKIKGYQKKKYEEVLEQKRAFWHEENKKWKVWFIADHKKDRDQKARRDNDDGLKYTKRQVQYGSKIIGENNNILKNFEQEIEETHKMFLKKIEEAFECAKDKDDTNTIDKIYLDLYTNDLRTVYDYWHDLRLRINVKFIKMAKEMGKKYSGSITCQCKKCQDSIGLENIKQAKLRIVPGLIKDMLKSIGKK